MIERIKTLMGIKSFVLVLYPHNNRQPFISLNYIIAVVGIILQQ
jgi:microcystin-dependent protein